MIKFLAIVACAVLAIVAHDHLIVRYFWRDK